MGDGSSERPVEQLLGIWYPCPHSAWEQMMMASIRSVVMIATVAAFSSFLCKPSWAQATGLQLPALACSVKKTVWVDFRSQKVEERPSEAIYRIDRRGDLNSKAPDTPEQKLGTLKKIDVDRWDTGTTRLVPIDLSFERVAFVSDMITLMTITYGDCVRTN
jgi:hypothetical protein